MSVLIKGMKIPKSCADCDLLELSGAIGCKNAYQIANEWSGRADNCPMVEFLDPPTSDDLYINLVKRGKWIRDDEGYHCSECFYHTYWDPGEEISVEWRYCPNCGAKMDLEEKRR